jgi:hypothetical protein
VEWLKQICSEESLVKISQVLKEKSISAGELIFREGDTYQNND